MSFIPHGDLAMLQQKSEIKVVVFNISSKSGRALREVLSANI